MTPRLAFTSPRMLLLASLLMACGGKGKSVGTDAGDRRDGSLRDVADARVGETASPDGAALGKDAAVDQVSLVLPDARADGAVLPDTALLAPDAEVDRFTPATPDTSAVDTQTVAPADAPWTIAPDAVAGFETRAGFDARPIDAAAPDAREAGAEASLSDAPADATRPIDQASPDVPYGSDGYPADAGAGDADLSDASPGGCSERPGFSCRVCNPVAPGAPVTIDVTDGISQLIADPSACLVYGFGWRNQSQMVVFDAAQKTVLTRVALGADAVDISLSPNGTFLVASLDKEKAIAVIDKATWTTRLVSTKEAPKSVVVDDRGVVYYLNWNWPSLRSVDLTVGSSSDKGLTNAADSGADLALSSDGTRLYWAEYGSTGCDMYLLDVTTATPTVVSKTTWDEGSGFGMPTGSLFVGPSRKHVYYANHQFDATNLALITGWAIDVYAEDSQARFVAGSYGILDAQTLTTLVPMPRQIQAAAFVSADTEVWTYSISEGKITCTNVADLTVGKTLGLREGTASAIGDFEFSKLIADPVRPRLYGLDAKKRQVVSIDRGTGAALRTVVVGSSPTDLEIDASGSFIYTGHFDTYAIAQIDAASLSFIKFIPSPQDSYDIAPMGDNRIVSNDMDQWNVPALIDIGTGKLLDSLRRPSALVNEAALFAAADGKSVFIGDSGYTGSNIVRYDVSGGTFEFVTSSYSGGGSGFGMPERRAVGTPDGTSIFYAGYCLDGTNLQTKRYALADSIFSVTPNGKLAISETKVYRVSDGTELAALPASCPIQAVAPDSSAVYCAGTGGISSFSLVGLQ